MDDVKDHQEQRCTTICITSTSLCTEKLFSEYSDIYI